MTATHQRRARGSLCATSRLRALAALALTTGLAAAAHAVPATEILSMYTGKTATAPSPSRGQALFTTAHGREWSCSSCHGATPTTPGKHASTGKPIAPLAPSFNAERFSDGAKVEKWFRRNCNDVLGRECTAAEKADVMSWLLTLKP